jgi:hypothetical protein
VNSEQAKAILQHYRPTVDAADPHFREALQQVQRDPALAQWFTELCTSYEMVRRTLRQTPVPAGLREAILQAHARRRPAVWWRPPAVVAAAVAAALIVITVIGYGVYRYHAVGTRPRDFAAYLQTITSVAAGGYTLAIATADPDVLRHYFVTTHAPTDYALPRGLRALRLEGGAVLEWFGYHVSMLCFEDEEPHDKATTEDHDVWFFVISRAALPDASASETPRFAPVHGLITVSWSRGDTIYVLATRGTKATLERLL